jgi:hypothetical protein
MKKIIFAIIISTIFSVWVQAWELIEMNKCSSYYDGCNTCSVENGEIGACTEMYCIDKWTPKCLKEIEEVKTIKNAQDLCEAYLGEFNESDWLCMFAKNSINAKSLYSVYMDFTGQMMYMGGSKYFDERIWSNNLALVQSDYNLYLFIQKNIPKLYKEYQKEIDSNMKSLSSKLNITTAWKLNLKTPLTSNYELLLERKHIIKIDIIVIKLLGKTKWMTHIEKERYLIKKVNLLEWLRNKFDAKNTNWKYTKVLNIIDYLYQKIESNIAYE